MQRPAGAVPAYDVDKDRAAGIFAAGKAEGRKELTTRESLDVLDAYGVRVCRARFAVGEDEAVAAARAVGYPVVMKMTSKSTSHKTDVGGVRVNIGSDDELRAQYRDLIAKLEARGILEGLEGVIIQEMVKSNRELVCGVAADPQYGPMIMFGTGGVFVEVMKDVGFALAPLTDVDAHELVRSVKAFKLLEGARGTTPADIARVEETLLRLSQLVTDFPAVQELDINPLMISNSTGEGASSSPKAEPLPPAPPALPGPVFRPRRSAGVFVWAKPDADGQKNRLGPKDETEKQRRGKNRLALPGAAGRGQSAQNRPTCRP